MAEIGNDDAVTDELLADGFAVSADENFRFFCTVLDHPGGSKFQGCGFLLVGAGKRAASLVECPDDSGVICRSDGDNCCCASVQAPLTCTTIRIDDVVTVCSQLVDPSDGFFSF